MSGLLAPEDLEREGIETVVLAAQEAHGRLVGRRISAGAFNDLVERGVTLPSCVLAWDFAQDMELELEYAGLHTGFQDVVLKPDPGSLRRAGWLEGTALCHCDFVEVADGSPVEIGPRNMLKRQLAWAAEQGFDPVVASELEFFLYRNDYDEARRRHYAELEPTMLIASDFSVRGADAMDPFFRRLRRALVESGVAVEFLQPETGLGQWEVNFGHADALRMADDHATFKHAVKVIAQEAGLGATFMARPSAEQIGSSCHIHISVRGEAGPVFHEEGAEQGVGKDLRAAIGGVLGYAPELMLFYSPNVNSYKRSASEDFAGCGGTWGVDNRTAACRTVGKGPNSTRFEFRIPGADVNPYNAIAALVCSVVQGIVIDADPGPPTTGNAYAQVSGNLPKSLGAAVAALRTSEFANERFGAAAVEHYARLGEREAALHAMAVTDWEMARYFENA